MAHIERRVGRRRDAGGRMRETVRDRIRYRDSAGKEHSETTARRADAERRKAELEIELARGTWRDPQRGHILLSQWVADWLPTRHDLRPTTRARLELTMAKQVLPRFGDAPLGRIT